MKLSFTHPDQIFDTGGGGSSSTSNQHHRELSGDDNDDDNNNYLVDAEGNSYEPYSLAWRYLGMYIDCDYYEDDEET